MSDDDESVERIEDVVRFIVMTTIFHVVVVVASCFDDVRVV